MALALLAAGFLLLPGCVGPASPQPVANTPPEHGSPPAPPGDPHDTPPPVMLRPGSNFHAEGAGFVRNDWQPPAAASPTIFVMDGYRGASGPLPTHYLRLRDGALLAINVILHHPLVPEGYVIAWASLRGTGCSSGTFDLFDRTSAWDGREAIEWLGAQNWTTGRIGLFGASYSGITAFHVASTQPPHLAAMSANMVIDDLYRGIAYPGGVPNIAFPVEWTIVVRPEEDTAASVDGVQAGDEICTQNLAARPPDYPANNPTVALMTRTLDDPDYQVRSLVNYAQDIRIPTSVTNAWQDEQTGPRGGFALWNAIHPDPVVYGGRVVEPKRFLGTNGVHHTAAAVALGEAGRWFDYWLRDVDNGILGEPPVKLFFGTKTTPGGNGFEYAADATLALDAFPSAATQWTHLYLAEGGKLSFDAPAAASAPDSYATGSPRQSWSFVNPLAGSQVTEAPAPDVLTYDTLPLAEAKFFAGPLEATLYATSTTPEYDMFVSVSDVGPGGEATYLARGLLRGSHRALDLARTQYDAAGDVVRPYHPHTNPQPVPLNQVVRYDVEVFPLAHVFQAGHKIRVQITTPPLLDGAWGYNPIRAPGLAMVSHDPDHASSLLVPLLAWPAGQPLPPDEPCGGPDGYRCVPSLAAR